MRSGVLAGSAGGEQFFVTASRLLSEVKHCRARLVLRWGTTLESLVLFFWTFSSCLVITYDLSGIIRRNGIIAILVFLGETPTNVQKGQVGWLED